MEGIRRMKFKPFHFPDTSVVVCHDGIDTILQLNAVSPTVQFHEARVETDIRARIPR